MRLFRMGTLVLALALLLVLAMPALAETGATLEVVSYVDQNGNGTRDTSEVSVAGGQVTVVDEAGNAVAEAALGADGQTLTGLANGTYELAFAPAAGYQASGATTLKAAITEGVSLNVAFGVLPVEGASAPSAPAPRSTGGGLYRVSGVLLALLALALPLGVRLLRRR